MSSETIYNVLSSKSANRHLINRYITFVLSCDAKNKSTTEYTEVHHICPKADDLFPEYQDLNLNKWNQCVLTAREHIIAHVMLWKIFGGSQTIALNYMLHVQNEETGYNMRRVPSSIITKYSALLREEAKSARKGFAVYKDSDNNKYLLHKHDPKIAELNLAGNNLGHEHSDEAKQKMSKAKYPNKTVKMYMLGCEASVKLFSNEFSERLAQGWTTHRTQDDIDYCKAMGYSVVSEKLTGTMRYCTPDGVYVGRFRKDDPVIKEQNLIRQHTENNKKQLESIRGLGALAITGTQIYNNGVSEARFKEPPDDPQWRLGRLERSKSHVENQKAAVRKALLGTKAWNNGVECKRFPLGYNPGDGWCEGMLPRKKTVEN